MKLDETKLQEVVEKIAYQQLGQEQIDDLYAKMGILNDYVQEQLRLFAVMPRFNLNHEVIIYPNERGFAKIKALIRNRYLLSNEEAETWVNKRKTEDGGYKEQLWVIVSDLHDMFYNGQSYMATTWIALLNEA